MAHNEHKHRMSVNERHILGIDHTANTSHGSSISAATAILVDEYTKQDRSSSILEEVTVSGLTAKVLVGSFPKTGKYRLTFSCSIGSEVFEDDIIITVEE